MLWRLGLFEIFTNRQLVESALDTGRVGWRGAGLRPALTVCVILARNVICKMWVIMNLHHRVTVRVEEALRTVLAPRNFSLTELPSPSRPVL